MNLYRAYLLVSYTNTCRRGNQTVHIAAYDIHDALRRARPDSGFANFEVLSIEHIGTVQQP